MVHLIIESMAGVGALSVVHLGNNYVADLHPNGVIEYEGVSYDKASDFISHVQQTRSSARTSKWNQLLYKGNSTSWVPVAELISTKLSSGRGSRGRRSVRIVTNNRLSAESSLLNRLPSADDGVTKATSQEEHALPSF